MVLTRPGEGAGDTSTQLPPGANPGSQSGPGTPSSSTQSFVGPQSPISSGMMNHVAVDLAYSQHNAEPAPWTPPGVSQVVQTGVTDVTQVAQGAFIGAESLFNSWFGFGGAAPPISQQSFKGVGSQGRLGGPLDREISNASANSANNAITGAAMSGFNDIAAGFADIFNAGFNAGNATKVALGLGKSTSINQVNELNFGPLGTIKGVSATGARSYLSNTAAYILPGGAILHGIGDTSEGTAARLFDVAAGSLIFAPGLGDLGEGLGAAARVGLGAGAGAAFGGIGSALHGGSLTQDLESAAFGGVLGAAGAYFIPKAIDALQYTTEDRPLLNAENPFDTAPRTTSLETTETGDMVYGTERTSLESGPSYKGGGSSYDEITATAKSTPKGTFAEPEDVGQAFADQSVQSTASKFLSEEAILGSDESATAGRGGFFGRSNVDVPETNMGEGSAGSIIRSNTTPVSDSAFESVKVSRFFGGNGVADTEDITISGREGQSNSEYYGKGTRGFTSEGTPSTPFEDNEAPPGGSSGGVEGSQGNGSVSLYETAGDRTAFGNAASDYQTKGFTIGRGMGDTGTAYLVTPPSYHGPTSKSTPISTQGNAFNIGQGLGTIGSQRTTPGNNGFSIPFNRWRIPQSTSPGTTPGTTDITTNIVIPTPSTSTTPTTYQTPKTTQNVVPSLLTQFDENAFALGSQQSSKPTNELPFPGLLTPFSAPMPGRRKKSGFAYDIRKHDLADLLSLSGSQKKGKNPFAL